MMGQDAFEKYGSKRKDGGKENPKKDATKKETPEVKEVKKEQTPVLDVASQVEAFHKQQLEKEMKGETHGNYTLVISHDTMERLDAIAEHFPRGFKSDLVNEALEAYVSAYEKMELPPKRNKRRKRG